MTENTAPHTTSAARFTKKSITIDAIQWTGKNLRDVITFIDGPPDTRTSQADMAWDAYTDLVDRDGLKISTLEGTMSAAIGDWIIKGVQGEMYPCKDEIFAATYSPDLAASAPVAPAPQPAPMPYPTDAQIDAVYEQTMGQHLRSQDAPAVRRFGRAMFLCAWNAAAPKAAPITEAEQAAWHAGLDEGRSQARVPLQQGEYLPLPEPRGLLDTGGGWLTPTHNFTGKQMRAYVDAHLAARGAAQAAPAYELAGYINHGIEYHTQGKTVFHKEPTKNLETRWWTPDIQVFTVSQPSPSAALAPVAEDAEIRKALHDAATSLETISRIAGKDQYMLEMMDVRLYAAARAKAAHEAQAAQPEGGGNANR